MKFDFRFLSGALVFATLLIVAMAANAADEARKKLYSHLDCGQGVNSLDEWKKDFPYSSDSPHTVARSLMHPSDIYCRSEVEGSIGIYQMLDSKGNPITGRYYAAEPYTDCNKRYVRFPQKDYDERGGMKVGKLVAIMHNHPNVYREEYEGVMFTNGDVMSGLLKGVDVYVGGCKMSDKWGNRALERLDIDTGEVREVKTHDGKPRNKDYSKEYMEQNGNEGLLVGVDCYKKKCLLFSGYSFPDNLTYEKFESEFANKYYNPTNYRKIRKLAEQRKKSKKEKVETDILSLNMPDEKSVDLHTLDLDDPDGDWCKCGDQTGCKETTFMGAPMVICQCSKCMKVNVKFARRALQLEKEYREKGIESQWFGDRNDAVKAANAK